MNINEQRALAEGLGKFLRPWKQDIDNLKARVQQLEQERAAMSYEGVFEAGKSYHKGQFVTHAGSVWHCRTHTIQRPGDGSDWQLAVKRGQDGRDAR